MIIETINGHNSYILIMNLAGNNGMCYLNKKTVSASGIFNCGFFHKV